MDSTLSIQENLPSDCDSYRIHQHCAEDSRARVTFRHASQDYVTCTKNPVLPSIHTEAAMVVPDPNRLKYAITREEGMLHQLQPQDSFQSPLSFEVVEEGDLKPDELTELRYTLPLSDDYYHPWN